MQISRQSDKLSPQSSNKCSIGVTHRHGCSSVDKVLLAMKALNLSLRSTMTLLISSESTNVNQGDGVGVATVVQLNFNNSQSFRKLRFSLLKKSFARKFMSIFRTNANLFRSRKMLFCSRNLQKDESTSGKLFYSAKEMFSSHRVDSQRDNFNLCKHPDSSLTFTDFSFRAASTQVFRNAVKVCETFTSNFLSYFPGFQAKTVLRLRTKAKHSDLHFSFQRKTTTRR